MALSLALCLALAIAPVWFSFQQVSVREGDRTVWALQGKVACARFEKDLRAATAEGCIFPAESAVLQATPSQVVLLVGGVDPTRPILVEWELAGGALMRRWAACPTSFPSAFPHSLYSDSKTMLENVDSVRSSFSCRVAGRSATLPLSLVDSPLVESTFLTLCERADNGRSSPELVAWAGVGR